jgi:hypothetical protein
MTTLRNRLEPSLYDKPNGPWHRPALIVFVLAHWAEHVSQAVQIWGLGWPRADARGILGIPFPWLVQSEWLHYGYAIAMLGGLWLLRKGFTGRSRTWWTAALVIQLWRRPAATAAHHCPP